MPGIKFANHLKEMRKQAPSRIIDRRLDCRGLYEPLPMLALRKALLGMQSGHIVELISDDPAAPVDFAAWCRATGHELMEIYDRGDRISLFIRCRRPTAK